MFGGNTKMENKLIEKIKEELLLKRKEIAGDVVNLRRESFSLGGDGGEDVGDDAANDYTRQVLLGMSERERTILQEVDAALDRIDDGIFGVCETCGEEISDARLKIVPYASLCVECKAETERRP